MDLKRWILAGLAAFAVVFVLDFIAHGRLLMGLYEQTVSVWRPQTEAHGMMGLMMLGQVLFGLLFAFIYAKGYESGKSGLGQGLRFGALIGVFVAVPYVSVWYVVLPIPWALALGWVASALVDCLVAGAVVGVIYKN
ncbi:MAG: hypothetical protein COV75_07650 [Candidatus Omnitrophica bacterium CG11_big_fil_rev_8_21_14_0_20_63_9]|nr:MAG: hypothetical protein COV75_07650 [Candidatus Omnitrophica bacterium CG11_big_fil_rev_8_21_14_0_20_63_9]